MLAAGALEVNFTASSHALVILALERSSNTSLPGVENHGNRQ
jgi:hypothetical protein